ncbi:hypothetical protein [Rhodanobacter sp. FW106-PBR-LB-2-11]|uniref:hypothetical protein n=1 Tax=Rhodanobacter sp. FW106-PBR-LB-2-11 TaxID=1524463 RepID=UPI0034E38EF6
MAACAGGHPCAAGGGIALHRLRTLEAAPRWPGPTAPRARPASRRWRRRWPTSRARWRRRRRDLLARGGERSLRLDEVEALLASSTLVVDACRHAVRTAAAVVPLARRPVLFALARALGEAWPDDVARHMLIARAFRTRYADDTHRARLRVEIGRLRAALAPLAEVRATPHGFVLVPPAAREVVVLARPVEEAHAAVLALLADGEAWSSSALALALGASQRSVQRALDALAAVGKVQPLGRGRARRWSTPPLPGFATVLLLPTPLPGD